MCVCTSALRTSGVCVCVFSVGSKASQGRQGLRESTAADLSVRKELLKVWLSLCVCVCVSAASSDCSPQREGGRVKPVPSVSMELPIMYARKCPVFIEGGLRKARDCGPFKSKELGLPSFKSEFAGSETHLSMTGELGKCTCIVHALFLHFALCKLNMNIKANIVILFS